MNIKQSDFVISLIRHGLGDEIARLPAALAHYAEGRSPYILTRSSLKPLVETLFPPGKVMTFEEYAARSELQTLPGVVVPQEEYPTSLNMHLTEHGFVTLMDRLPISTIEQSYPRVQHIEHHYPKRHVVIATDHTAPNRQFPAKYINEIGDFLVSKNYLPVYIGGKASDAQQNLTQDNLLTEGRLDLRGQTSIKEAFDIIASSRLLISMDSGLVHLAGLSDVPIVCGYTTVAPEKRMPYRRGLLGRDVYPVVPHASLECRFCQNKYTFNWEADYRLCFRQDYKCLSQTNTMKFISQIKLALGI